LLQQYICWVQQLQPRMTLEAEEVLLKYYQVQRSSSCRDASRTTVRMFESLIRIAQVANPHPPASSLAIMTRHRPSSTPKY
jgi:DNA replicative helicase MCM subunit Mcm2 (Cdc46/Mcm family)